MNCSNTNAKVNDVIAVARHMPHTSHCTKRQQGTCHKDLDHGPSATALRHDARLRAKEMFELRSSKYIGGAFPGALFFSLQVYSIQQNLDTLDDLGRARSEATGPSS